MKRPDHDPEEALAMAFDSHLPASPDHQRVLLERLLTRLEQRHPPQEKSMFRRVTFRLLVVGAVALAGIGVASVPTDFEVELGKRVEIVAEPNALPVEIEAAVEAVVAVLSTGNDSVLVEAQVSEVEPGAEMSMVFTLWAKTVPVAQMESALREQVPGLAGARITVSTVQGSVPTSFAGLLARRLFADAATPEEIAAAREALVAHLRGVGDGGTVDVEVEDDSAGTRRIKVRVDESLEVLHPH